MKTVKNNVVIEAISLSKSFKVPLESSNGLKQKIINSLKGRKGYRFFTPLSDISFTINEGDFFGIVGRNGSGKSTLLKTLAGIYTPNKGSLRVKGNLVPFIELGVGFNPELTGKENVYLNGALLGFSRKEIQSMYDEIVDFSELHDFMEERLKNYSSGMQVRLAFSIAIKARGDILLLDEVLAVGDEAFQQKCYDYFEKLKRDKKTVVLVSHDMASIERFCTRAMLIEKGRVVKIGKSAEIAQLYRALFAKDVDEINKSQQENLDKAYNEVITNVDVKTVQAGVDEADKILVHEPFTVLTRINTSRDISTAHITLTINNSHSQPIAKLSTSKPVRLIEGENKLSFNVKDNVFVNDIYTVDIAIEKSDTPSSWYAVFIAGDVSSFSVFSNQSDRVSQVGAGQKTIIALNYSVEDS